MNTTLLLFVVGTLMLMMQPVVAQEQQKPLDNLSLEELLNVEISTASKSSEKIQDAPGIITVVSHQEIEAFGANSLVDVLDRVTSFYMLGTFFLPENMVSIRGDNTSQFNTRVLVLLNGRPVRESLQGGHNSPIYTMMPLSRIERLEIIRGPGSSLYGTNAYTGVINIITKTANSQGIDLEAKYGSFNRVQGTASGGVAIGGIEIAAGVNYVNDGGWTFSAFDERIVPNSAPPVPSTKSSTPMSTRGVGVNLEVRYENLRLQSYFAVSDQAAMGSVPIWRNSQSPGGASNLPFFLDFRNEGTRLFADAEYRKQFSNEYELSVNLTYNFYRLRHFTTAGNATLRANDDLQRGFSNDLLLEVTNYFTPTNTLQFVIGGLLNNISGISFLPERSPNAMQPLVGSLYNIFTNPANPTPFENVPPYNDLQWSVYAQANYKPFDFLRLIAGGQANKVPGLALDFVPRLGAIATLSPSLSAKVLFGQAFRSATGAERFIRLPNVVYGDELLRPEKITTLEGQMYYQNTGSVPLSLAITVFQTSQNDVITRSLPSDSLVVIDGINRAIPRQVNRGTLTSMGVEFEGQISPAQGLTFQSSATYQTNENHLGERDVTGMPQLLIKVGAFYATPFGLNLGIFNSFVGNNVVLRTQRNVNPPVESFNYLTANLSFDLKSLIPTLPHITLAVYGTNLLDARIAYPEYIRRIINSIPGRPERALYGSIQVRF